MLQVAVIMAVKGGMAGDVTVGDCLELLEARARAKGDSDNGGTYFYQLLHAAGFLPAGAPPRAGMLNPRVRGQLSAGQLIDRYDLACRAVRDLLVDYLNERGPGIDYVTMNGLAWRLRPALLEGPGDPSPRNRLPLTWHRTWRWRGNSGCSPARSRPRDPAGSARRTGFPACQWWIT